LGIDNLKLLIFQRQKTEIYDTSSMQKAVEVSKSIAEKGDVVLFLLVVQVLIYSMVMKTEEINSKFRRIDN
jgi:hypothetical protein